MKIKILILCSFCLFCSLLISTTWQIKQDGTGNFTTIQDGIDASADADTVLVYPGTYFENLDFNGKNIMLCSLELTTGNPQYIDSTVIDGQRQGSCIRIHNGETNARVQGFTITNGYGTQFWARDGGGILLHDYSTAFITNCVIMNNIASAGAGLYARHGYFNLSGLVIINNSANLGGAIYINDESTINFDTNNRCSIYNNNAGKGADLYIEDSGQIDVFVDTFTVFNPSRFFAEYFGDSSYSFVIQNNWMVLEPHDLYVAPDGDDINSGLTPQEPLKNISWAVRKIQADEANPHTIHVAAGTYSWEDNQQVYPIGCKEYVSVTGANMDNTVIIDDYFGGIITGKNVSGKIEFSDLSIKIDEDIDCYSLINVYLIEYFVLKNISLENNINQSLHSLISNEYVYNFYDNIQIVNNQTSDYNCGFHLAKNAGKMKNCIVNNNSSNMQYPSNNVVAMQLMAYDDFTIENCVFAGNYSTNTEGRIIRLARHDGIGPSTTPTIRFNSCLITDNSIGSNYVIQNFNYDGLTEFNNCTIANNSSEAYTLYNCGDLNLTNTIMYNPDNGIEVYMRDDTMLNGNIYTLNVDNCNIWQGLEGGIYNQNDINNINWNDGNINDIPDFLGYGDDPYQLSELSPCIDTGTPDTTGLFLPPWDLLNNNRIWDGDGNGIAAIDMGCYEYGAEPYVDVEDPIIIPCDEINLSNYPNPFNPETTISFSLIEAGEVKLEIYNIKGQKIKILMDCAAAPGKYKLIWKGKDNSGRSVASGVYFYQLITPSKTVSKRMLLLK